MFKRVAVNKVQSPRSPTPSPLVKRRPCGLQLAEPCEVLLYRRVVCRQGNSCVLLLGLIRELSDKLVVLRNKAGVVALTLGNQPCHLLGSAVPLRFSLTQRLAFTGFLLARDLRWCDASRIGTDHRDATMASGPQTMLCPKIAWAREYWRNPAGERTFRPARPRWGGWHRDGVVSGDTRRILH